MTEYDGNTEAEGSPPPGVRSLTRGMRWLLLVASLLDFIIGIPLFLLSEQTDRYFAWTISVPLTAAFLGAGYWSSFFNEFVGARERVWANSRVAVPAVFVFTVLTLVATLIHLDLFHLGGSFAAITQIGTWTWMAVYVSVGRGAVGHRPGSFLGKVHPFRGRSTSACQHFSMSAKRKGSSLMIVATSSWGFVLLQKRGVSQ
jgi:hypothetical protein